MKGRRSRAFGGPAESVTLEKQRRILGAAEAYIARTGAGRRLCRFDVVSVDAREGERSRRVTILRDAFRGPLPPRRG